MSVSSFDEWLVWDDHFRTLPDDLRSKILDHIRRQESENYKLRQHSPVPQLIASINACREMLINANTRRSAVDWMHDADQLLKKCVEEISK